MSRMCPLVVFQSGHAERFAADQSNTIIVVRRWKKYLMGKSP
jgi:hypothetical protein